MPSPDSAIEYLVTTRIERLCGRISKTLADAGITREMALATLPDARKRVFERHYQSRKRPAKKAGLRT